MLRLGDTVFVIVDNKVLPVTIHNYVTLKGVVTGYQVASKELERQASYKKSEVFTNEEAAGKELFLKTLKADKEPRQAPSTDKVSTDDYFKRRSRSMDRRGRR